ncbi:MAG: UDP-2,4-diacetamido-2,4,6-trideoxy-beta-L-altropyranose hydrolase [Eubacterium sp.]|nr:UDP-2,4-diacetamido-2,4,6-trideoxy-beta-L-altropyranose hydrolase [Eubacterium sp.]
MILIRADGNSIIGAGHIMRCLSIADAFCDAEEDVLFVLADETFQDVIRERGFRVHVLHTDYRAAEEETDLLIPLLLENPVTCFLADSYYVTEAYLGRIREYTKVVYLDDLGETAWPVDVLVNYNISASPTAYASLYSGADREDTALLLGCSYTPLRREFQNIPAGKKQDGKRIFVSSGGADPEHVELRLLQWLVRHPDTFPGYEFCFVVGAVNPDYAQILSLSKDMNRVTIYRNVSRMQELMSGCAIAVSAAGSTLYELCACGLPILTYITADNQIPAEKAFVEAGIAWSAGDVRTEEDFVETLFQSLDRLLKAAKQREEMSDQAITLVDGKGAARIVKGIMDGIHGESTGKKEKSVGGDHTSV